LFAQHLTVLAAPEHYQRSLNAAVEEIRRNGALPEFRKITGNASVDCFGYCQIYALFNGLNYRPAPVFQSYAACDERLTRLNEQFYLSPAAPDYVIFTLGPMDRKFPPLDDSRVLRDFLINYAPVGTEGRFLLLKKNRTEPPRMSFLRAGVVKAGDTISLASFGETNLWLELDLQPSWAGQLRELLYRPPVVRLAAWPEGGKKPLTRQRSPAANLAAGFIASPLFERTKDIQDFMTGKPVTRPAAYSVHMLPGEELWWQAGINYRVYAFNAGEKEATKGDEKAR